MDGRSRPEPTLLGDVVLARKEMPTSYHLAVTLDDALQGVTLVTRGADLFAATHIHRLLQALLGLPTPRYRHHPLLTDAHGRRLAKRDGARDDPGDAPGRDDPGGNPRGGSIERAVKPARDIEIFGVVDRRSAHAAGRNRGSPGSR